MWKDVQDWCVIKNGTEIECMKVNIHSILNYLNIATLYFKSIKIFKYKNNNICLCSKCQYLFTSNYRIVVRVVIPGDADCTIIEPKQQHTICHRCADMLFMENNKYKLVNLYSRSLRVLSVENESATTEAYKI